MSRRLNLLGQRFGRLVVLEDVGNNINNESMWLCRCDCGNQVIIQGSLLKRGTSSSCGCLRKEQHLKATTKHGLYGSTLYHTWQNIHQRCSNPNESAYYRYGGRGIQVCDEWDEYKPFYDWSMNNGYEQGLTIDRINNDGNYEPDNCRWVDNISQQNNKCNNRRVTYNGTTHTVAEWSRILGVKYTTLMRRVNRNDMTDFERYFDDKVD